MNLTQLLFRRETFGTRLPILPSLRPICLWDILPSRLRDEVFLGFTADGRFLVSYVFRLNDFKLSFWFIPGDNGSPNTWLDKPFAVFTTSISTSRIHDQIGVRFIQSASDPQVFVLIYSVGTDYISIVWGTLPEPTCSECRRACSLMETRFSFSCHRHFQLLILFPDCYFSPYGCVSTWCTGTTGNNFNHFPESSSGQRCLCMIDLTSSVHPSVCPETGRLRVTWISQGRQIRLLSCSFSGNSSCAVPMGSYTKHRKPTRGRCVSIPPLAQQGSFLTSNYCTFCFSWPDGPCHGQYFPENPPFLPSVWGNCDKEEVTDCNKHCALATLPIRIVRGADPWPEGHRRPLLLARNFLQGHKCLEQKNLFEHWSSSLLTRRTRLRSCKPLNYLAMLQDIHASYIHWALLPQREDNKNANLRSASTTLSPDRLLANRLCGQCHSYFDTQKWRPYDQSRDLPSDISVIAHMEEVVFDIPEYSENLTDRVLFASPLEPNWILVYDIDKTASGSARTLSALIDVSTGRQIDPDAASYADRLRTMQSRCPAWLRFSSLVSPRSFTLPTRLAASPLPRISFPYTPLSQTTTLMELNNLSLISSRSLDRLCDPQGGFALCL